MSTINDKSNSHIAEMLIKGTNMGIIEGVKLKNQNPDANQTTQKILDDFIQFQENTIEKLKKIFVRLYRLFFKKAGLKL